MRANTETVTLSCTAQRAYQFLSQPENLPRWATGFCRSIRKDGERWVAETPQGEVDVRFVTDPEHGVVDYHLSLAPGVEVVAASRVVPNGDGAEYIFTQFQAPGMPEEVFEQQVRALREELHELRSVVGG